MSEILLVNDMPGYGKVALSAMLPVLSAKGHSLYNLPTALVSNTLDYGKFEILDTTAYMKNTIAVWRELGFRFDCIATGFIASGGQVPIIKDFAREQKAAGAVVMADPIMGDNGRLYNGVGRETVQSMRELLEEADLMVPNLTEALFLADPGYAGGDGAPVVTERRAEELARALSAGGSRAVVITSVALERGGHCVYGYSRACGPFRLDYEEIPVRFPGTGDLFSSVLLGEWLNGVPLPRAARSAMAVVARLIEWNRGREDAYRGVPVEQYLKQIEEICHGTA